MKELRSKNRRREIILALFAVLSLAVLFAGCTSNSPAGTGSQNTVMQEKAAFIAAANNCTNTTAVITDDVGTFQYSSSDNCTFTKTLVQLNGTEMQEMKTMLEGKSMTCNYAQGSFDPRLVTSLVGGTEYCSGDLKDDITNMMLFST
jgi:hypothetical protein